MDSCSKHKKEVAGISDMAELAELIGDLHYETLAKLLRELQAKLRKDAKNDLKGERFKLSYALERASDRIHEASNEIKLAYQISKTFMKSEKHG